MTLVVGCFTILEDSYVVATSVSYIYCENKVVYIKYLTKLYYSGACFTLGCLIILAGG